MIGHPRIGSLRTWKERFSGLALSVSSASQRVSRAPSASCNSNAAKHRLGTTRPLHPAISDRVPTTPPFRSLILCSSVSSLYIPTQPPAPARSPYSGCHANFSSPPPFGLHLSATPQSTTTTISPGHPHTLAILPTRTRLRPPRPVRRHPAPGLRSRAVDGSLPVHAE